MQAKRKDVSRPSLEDSSDIIIVSPNVVIRIPRKSKDALRVAEEAAKILSECVKSKKRSS